MSYAKNIMYYSEIINKVNELITFGLSEEDILKSVKNKYDNIDPAKVEDVVKDTINNHSNYIFIKKIMRSKVVVNVQTDEHILFDKVKKNAEPVSIRTIRNVLHRKFDVNSLIVACRFDYSPDKNEVLWHDKDTDMHVFNTYIPPTWYSERFYSNGKKKVKYPDEGLPKIYQKFFEHLTDGDERSYQYILDWLANAIQSRNFCILATIGKPGVGKGILGNIMRGIFGKSNYYAGSDRMFKGKFNSQIMNKRLVYCDEVSIRTKEDEDKLKLVVNDFIEVEKKGIDAEEIQNYANFYISSNNLDAIKISGDDRRFSIVNLTDKKLITKFNDDKIKELLLQKNIDKLAGFLYYRKVDKEGMKKVFISERTQLVRESSLREWQDWFITEYCVDNAGKTLQQRKVSNDVEDEFGSKFRPSRSSLEKLRDLLPPEQRVFDIRKKSIGGKQVWSVVFEKQENV